MITVGMPAQIVCDEPECDARGLVQICLMATGGFGWKPLFKDKWQIGAANNGVLVSRCEKHAKVIQPASIILGAHPEESH